MGTNLNHLLNQGNRQGQGGLLLLSKPGYSGAYKVSGEGGKLLLKHQGCGAANLEVVHLKDILALLDARFNGLTSVVAMKPAVQVAGDRLLSIVKENGMPVGFPGLIARQKFS